jgi:hypothetical protein
MPPAACMAADAVITAMMMKNALIGGSPGVSLNAKIKIAVPAAPQRPSPIPPSRTPMTMAMMTTTPSTTAVRFSLTLAVPLCQVNRSIYDRFGLRTHPG